MFNRPTAAQSVSAERVDDDVCLYRSDTHEVLVLNSTAADIWYKCDGRHAPEDVLTQLAEKYGIAAEDLRADVNRVLIDLANRGYLVESTSEATRLRPCP